MKSCIVVCETETQYSDEAKKTLAAAGMKPGRTVAWLFLMGKSEAESQKHAVLRVYSPKHAERIYEVLTRLTLARFAKDPTTGMFVGMTGRWLSQATLDVVKAMNIPKGDVEVVRVRGKRQ